MTKERALYILKNTLMGGEYKFAFLRACDVSNKQLHPDGITEQEDREIKALWDTMPGHTCYANAVQRIAYPERLDLDYNPDRE